MHIYIDISIYTHQSIYIGVIYRYLAKFIIMYIYVHKYIDVYMCIYIYVCVYE